MVAHPHETSRRERGFFAAPRSSRWTLTARAARGRPTHPGRQCMVTTNIGMRCPTKEQSMLYWAAVFFIIAIIAAILGFGGIAASAAGIAKLLFIVFLIIAIVAFLMGRGRNVP